MLKLGTGFVGLGSTHSAFCIIHVSSQFGGKFKIYAFIHRQKYSVIEQARGREKVTKWRLIISTVRICTLQKKKKILHFYSSILYRIPLYSCPARAECTVTTNSLQPLRYEKCLKIWLWKGGCLFAFLKDNSKILPKRGRTH